MFLTLDLVLADRDAISRRLYRRMPFMHGLLIGLWAYAMRSCLSPIVGVSIVGVYLVARHGISWLVGVFIVGVFNTPLLIDPKL